MAGIRLIARLDVKGSNLIKGVHLEGLRVIGDPHEYAHKYYEQGADEIIYMDCVASLYGRNNLTEIVRHTSEDVFIPMTVGGGVRSVKDVEMLLRVGADKVTVNTAAVGRPELITEIATRFGSQCMVLSIEAKHKGPGKWEAYIDNGREKSGLDVVEWAKRGESLGAGEILLTSIDREGTRKGFEIDLIAAVSSAVSIPIIASGGMGNVQDLVDVVKIGRTDAVAMADILHYNRMTFHEIRQEARTHGIEVSVR
jgi:imidazole glycerol-phosphate synthase subunit HisF